MPDSSSDVVILKKILGYAEDIQNISDFHGNDRELFMSSEPEGKDYLYSVSMAIMQIGELAKSLSDEKILKDTGIPWKEIKGMRVWFAHKYGTMDKDMIWNTVQNDIPGLIDGIKKVL